MTKREQDKHSKMLIERAALQLRREEEEKQRHKEMFAKKPTSSFQNVAKLGMTSGDKHAQGQQQQEEGLGDLPPRTKSALSLLLNPDPSIFPENHPYRRGYSSGELVRPGPSHMMGLTGMGGFGPMTSINAGGAQRPQMHPIQMGHDARMDQAGPPQRKLGAEDRLLSERIRARDAAEVEQKQKQAAQDEQERVRQLVAQKEKLEEEERAKRARIQQVEQEEKAQQKQLQQALQERAQRQQQQQQQRQPQRRVTDPPPPPNAQPPQEQQRPQHRRQASHASQQPKASRPPSIYQQGGVGSMMPMAFRGVGTANKSSAAMPVASQVDIGPIAGFERPPGPAGNTSTSNNPAQKGAPGHRPRGPPQGQELDTDSEDEAEDKENANALNMAKSIAEQKLRMFAEKRGIVPAPLGPAPAAAPPSPLRPHAGPSAQRPHSQVIETTPPWARQPHQDPRFEDHRGNGGPRVTPQPIPLMHPYNLPVAAIPTTPRTTRKLMLRTELSESVRRGLLWERQQGVKPIKRTASASNAEGIARFPPIPQLAASPSMVQLRPKVRRLEGQEQGVITAPVKKATPEELEERKKRALARNRSDANNFHTSGW
ncbi:hypothetical protein BKA70DRAFT_724918 [Coprinopsis sp. MPI-PUGE-AT-0042]|nr:hypothetical protein BKA70DRAFT_724918 [Coprinopsis sp. MPI-PUGE-AT-0042]